MGKGIIIWRAIYKCYFNPIIFLIYYLFFSQFPGFSTQVSTNVTKLSFLPYLIIWGLIYYFSILTKAFLLKKSVIDIIIPPTPINSNKSGSYIIIAITLMVSMISWMEGNIFGFFFFLPICISVIYFLSINIHWIFVYFNSKWIPSIWFLFSMISLLPIYIIIFSIK